MTIPLKQYRTVPVEPLRREDRHRHQQLLPAARRPHPRAGRRVDDDVGAAAGAPARVEGREGVQPHPRGAPDHRWPVRAATATAGRSSIAGDDAEAKATRGGADRPVRLRRRRCRPARRGLAHPARHARLRPAPHGRGAAAGSRRGATLPRHVGDGGRQSASGSRLWPQGGR